MFDSLFAFSISLFDLLIFQKYLKEVIGTRITSNRTSALFFITCVIIWSFTDPKRNPLVNLTISISVLLIFSLQYTCTFSIRLIFLSLYIGIGFLTEPITLIIFRSGDFNGENYLVSILSELLRFLIVLLIGRMKLEKVAELPKNISRLLIIIPLISVLNYCLVIQIAASEIKVVNLMLCFTIIITMATTNYLLFYIFNKFNDVINQKHEDELYIQEMRHKEAYYAEVQECNEYVQDIKHDLKNRLGTLYDCIDQSGAFAADKIKELLLELEHVDQRIYTENAALNSILKIKFTLAKEYMIQTDVKVQVPMNMKIDCGDLGIVYGNLLDNAIEACEKVDFERRYITLESKYIEGSLILILKNSKCSEKIEGLKTSKADKRNHGRGINSVKRVVEKYNGTIKMEDTVENFEVNIILYGIGA